MADMIDYKQFAEDLIRELDKASVALVKAAEIKAQLPDDPDEVADGR